MKDVKYASEKFPCIGRPDGWGGGNASNVSDCLGGIRSTNNARSVQKDQREHSASTRRSLGARFHLEGERNALNLPWLQRKILRREYGVTICRFLRGSGKEESMEVLAPEAQGVVRQLLARRSMAAVSRLSWENLGHVTTTSLQKSMHCELKT
jgi:hypothetical protein